MEIIRSDKFSQKILAKLEEFKSNKNVPFSSKILLYEFEGEKCYETFVLSFDKKGLRLWFIGFLDDSLGDFKSQLVEIQTSKEFLDWISQFKQTTKMQLINNIMTDSNEMMKVKCERCNMDFEKIKKEKKLKDKQKSIPPAQNRFLKKDAFKKF